MGPRNSLSSQGIRSGTRLVIRNNLSTQVLLLRLLKRSLSLGLIRLSKINSRRYARRTVLARYQPAMWRIRSMKSSKGSQAMRETLTGALSDMEMIRSRQITHYLQRRGTSIRLMILARGVQQPCRGPLTKRHSSMPNRKKQKQSSRRIMPLSSRSRAISTNSKLSKRPKTPGSFSRCH